MFACLPWKPRRDLLTNCENDVAPFRKQVYNIVAAKGLPALPLRINFSALCQVGWTLLRDESCAAGGVNIKNVSCWQPGRQAGSPFPMGNNCNYTLPEWSPRGNKSKGYLFTPPHFLPRILILPSVPLPPNKCAPIYIQFPDPSR